MSALDNLKDGSVNIDITNPDHTVGVMESDSVQEPATIGRAKTIITQNNQKPQTATVAPRQSVNVSTIAPQDEEDADMPQNAGEALAKSILEGPDSAFSKYVEKETSEYHEWMAEQQEKAELEAANKDEKSMEQSAEASEGKGSLISDDFDEDSDDASMDIDDMDVTDDLDIDAADNDEVYSEQSNAALTETDESSNDEDEVFDAPDIDLDVEEGVESIGDSVEDATDDNDDEEINNSEIAETDDDTILKQLQDMATERLKPTSKKLDISSFTVVKKPVTNVMPFFKPNKAKVAKWVLPTQKATIFVKEFSGSELEKLREYSEDRNSVDALNRRFHMIYDHIASARPSSFEQWLKVTPYRDVDHYFFAIYIASFNGANFLPEDCINTRCKKTFLTDDIKIMDMVKFENSKAKEEFSKLYKSEASPVSNGLFVSEVVPLSESVAIGFREPSIYNVFELASLDDATRRKYSSIIDYIPYIDELYVINQETHELIPVGYKKYTDNAVKTVQSKLQKYEKIFNTLSVDEFGPVKAYVRDIIAMNPGMYYVYPSVECPQCHTMTEEQRTSAEELVFTRYQLGALTNTSLN
jgi:hypothetical protein